MFKVLTAGLAAAALGGAAHAASAEPAPALFTNDAAMPAARLDSGLFKSGEPVALHEAQYFWGGRRYCWYGGGWRGPGWYWCGYAWRHGWGWGGGEGWRGWHRGWDGGRGWRHGGGWRDGGGHDGGGWLDGDGGEHHHH